MAENTNPPSPRTEPTNPTGGLTPEAAEITVRPLDLSDPAVLKRLSDEIRQRAWLCATGGSAVEREMFSEAAVAEILVARSTTIPSRISRYDPTRPFRPWLNTVLRNLWLTQVKATRGVVVNSELVGGVESGPFTSEERNDLPALTEDGYFLPAVSRKMVAATNTARLVAFLAMTELHPYFRDWDLLVGQYERRAKRPLPRPFPSLELDHIHGTRTRTGPLAEQMGIRLPNTLTQTFRRACNDLQAAFPELDLRADAVDNRTTTNDERYR